MKLLFFVCLFCFVLLFLGFVKRAREMMVKCCKQLVVSHKNNYDDL